VVSRTERVRHKMWGLVVSGWSGSVLGTRSALIRSQSSGLQQQLVLSLRAPHPSVHPSVCVAGISPAVIEPIRIIGGAQSRPRAATPLQRDDASPVSDLSTKRSVPCLGQSTVYCRLSFVSDEQLTETFQLTQNRIQLQILVKLVVDNYFTKTFTCR